MVPANYFNMDSDDTYKGTCVKWGTYKSTSGEQLMGYYVQYDAGDGDAYWMLEKDVHGYILSE